MTKQTVVNVTSSKYFTSQKEARAFAIKLLEAGLTYFEITTEEVKK